MNPQFFVLQRTIGLDEIMGGTLASIFLLLLNAILVRMAPATLIAGTNAGLSLIQPNISAPDPSFSLRFVQLLQLCVDGYKEILTSLYLEASHTTLVLMATAWFLSRKGTGWKYLEQVPFWSCSTVLTYLSIESRFAKLSPRQPYT